MGMALWTSVRKRWTDANLPFYEKVSEFTSDEDLTEFIDTAVAGGTAAAVVDTVNGGAAQIAAAATTADSGRSMQMDAANVILDLGKEYLFWTRLRFGEAAGTVNAHYQSKLVAGLCIVDTTLYAGFTNGIAWRKANAAATAFLDGYAIGATGAASTSASLASVGHDTWHDLAFWVRMDAVVANKGSVDFYFDGIYKDSINSLSLPANTIVLTPSIEYQSGDDTGTKHLQVQTLRMAGTY